MPDVVNIAGYQFVPLNDLPPLRERLLRKCKSCGLRGTILLSSEGINLFVAGERDDINSLLADLRQIAGLEQFSPKISISQQRPFNRMLVRIKKEIIAFGVEGIDPAQRTSPKLAPKELKRWLDEGRPVTLLDTRNDYEVKLGTFRNARTLGIDHFRDFPSAVEQLPAELKQSPIVMFCTGGIRCEKAGPYMERVGFEQILQLDGGILKYFEECGGEHYSGECFVFDQRVGVDPSLAETDNTQCFRCLEPLSADDQQDPRYVPGQSCPACYRTDAQRMAEAIAKREADIRKVVSPLPGSQPYDNDRPIKIAEKFAGQTLLATLQQIFPHLPVEHWHQRFAEGLLMASDLTPVAADRRVESGERYLHRFPATSEPPVNVDIRLLHEDGALVVVDKPAPLPLHPSGRFNRNTLQYILNLVYAPQKLRPVHRLDANTTGVALFARTRNIASAVQAHFERGEVRKLYLARVQGQPTDDEFVCDAPIGVAPTELGGRAVVDDGAQARTEFRVVRRFDDGASLVEANPVTGRTNQIRVHLWRLGWPIVGEQTYLPGQQLGDTQTHATGSAALCLHAWRITLQHPLSQQAVTYESPAPAWACRSTDS